MEQYKIRIASVQLWLELVYKTLTLRRQWQMPSLCSKRQKNLRRKLFLLVLPDSSVDLSTLGIVVLTKIRLRCFRATDKMWKFIKNIKTSGRYGYVAKTSKFIYIALVVNKMDNEKATCNCPYS